MRVLITLDGSEISESAAVAVSQWAKDIKPEVLLLMVLHPDDIKQTSRGGYHYEVTPKGTMSGQLLAVADQNPPPAESRTQAIDRARSETSEYLASVARTYFPGVQTENIVDLEEDVPDAVTRTAERQGADLVAMGTHGRTGLGQVMLGSVAEAVVRHATVPVLLVGPATREQLQSDRAS